MDSSTPIRLGIIGAMPEEVTLLRASLRGKVTTHEFASLQYTVGQLEGIPVVLAQSGIGKINAALCTQLMIDRFHPEAIVFTGVAGGLIPGCRVGDLVVATHTVQHDYDISMFRGQKGFVPYPTPLGKDNPEVYEKIKTMLNRATLARLEGTQLIEADVSLRALACRAYDDIIREGVLLPPLYAGIIASGDQFINDPAVRLSIQREFGALCAEMEGAATAYTCFLNNVPFLLLRALSDTADGEAVTDFPKFCASAAETSARLVKRIAVRLHHSLQTKVEVEYKWVFSASPALPDTARVEKAREKIDRILMTLELGRSEWSVCSITDVYFDTKDYELARRGAMVRLRLMGEHAWLICKLPALRQGAQFRRPEFKRLIVFSMEQFEWSKTLRDVLKGLPVAEELSHLAQGGSMDVAELWNTRPSLIITNQRHVSAISLGPVGLVEAYIDDITFVRANQGPVPRNCLELEIEVIREPSTEAEKSVLQSVITGLPKILKGKESSHSKYLVGLEAMGENLRPI